MRHGPSAAFLRRVRDRISAYAAHDDPTVAACNLIALVVASNQPLYPLYVLGMASEYVSPTFFTFLSIPFFLAVPAAARRSAVAGQSLLVITGMANTVLGTWLIGQASGVEIFLIPCALVPALFMRATARPVAFVLIGLALLIYLRLDGSYGLPVHRYADTEYRALVRLNATSAGALTVFVGLVASSALTALRTRTHA